MPPPMLSSAGHVACDNGCCGGGGVQSRHVPAPMPWPPTLPLAAARARVGALQKAGPASEAAESVEVVEIPPW